MLFVRPTRDHGGSVSVNAVLSHFLPQILRGSQRQADPGLPAPQEHVRQQDQTAHGRLVRAPTHVRMQQQQGRLYVGGDD